MSTDGHPNLASPRSTGGHGPNFEQHVDAAFLVLLLCGGSCPFFSDGIVEEVNFQASHRGWRTDDLLIVVSMPGGSTCRVAIQVKQSFSLSDKNDECKKTFLRAFNDFNDSRIFNKTQDRIGLIIGLESKNLLTGLRSLLDAARASLSAADMLSRLEKKNYIGKVPFTYFKTIKGILATEHSSITDDEVRSFLRVFDFVSLDLLNSSSSSLGLLHSLLRSTASDPVSAVATWNSLLSQVSEDSGRAGSFNRSKLPPDLTERHSSLGATHASGLQRLRRDCEIVMASISHRLSNGHVIPRTVHVDKILDRTETDRIVMMTGEAGAGKSGAVALAVESLRRNSPEINIETSMSAFIRELGFPVTGGKRGTIGQFKEQLRRLAASRMQLGLWEGNRTFTINSQPIEAFDVWLPTNPDQRILWNSKLHMDQRFFESLKEHALPVDIRALRGFTHSAKQIDILLWLGYRIPKVRKPSLITWERLREQFGYRIQSSQRKFKHSFKKDLEAIKSVYPKLRVNATERGLMLNPTKSDLFFVPPKKLKKFG